MIIGLLWLLVCQLIGEVVVRLTGAPIPGPVVGMVVLFVALCVRRTDGGRVVQAGEFLLGHLQLFFIPAGVGVVVYLGVLRAQALPIGVALVGSWLGALLVVGWLLTWLLRGRAEAPGVEPAAEEIE